LNSTQQNTTPARKSAILRVLHRVTAWLYALILDSVLGRYLTGYRKTSEAFSHSRIRRLFRSKRKRSDRVTFRIRHSISSVIEKSAFCRLATALERVLLQCSVNSYGIFLLFFGCLSIVSYYVTVSLSPESSSVAYLITGVALVVFSLPLFASTRSLAHSLRQSAFFHGLLIDILGLAEERFRSYEQKGEEHYLEALIVAILFGSLTFRYPPYTMLAIAFSLVLLFMILRDPEVGMLLSVALCPLFALIDRPTMSLLVLVGVTLFSFVVKLLCGKRVLRLELTDAAILLLGLLYLLGGIVTKGGRASLQSALAYALLMTIYIMVANLVRSQDGIRRMIHLLIVTCTVIALYGLWQRVADTVDIAYVDMSLFSDLGGRVYATWENPNMLAEYLTLLLPLIFAHVLQSERFMRGLGYALCFALAALCLVFTWSRGAWLGVAVSLFLMMLCLSHKVLSFVLLGVLPAAALLPLTPERIARRFVSIGNLADSSVLYRLNLWKGVGAMLNDYWLTGVGAGESAFCAVYSRYALPGIESAMHPHSLYLSLLCSLGVVGLVVFAAAWILWLRRALEYYRFGEWRGARLTVLGGVAGVTALLIMGLFDDVFYNYRIFFMFWAVMGLVSAQLRIGERRTERTTNPIEDERTQGEVTFRFH
jgi:O-antigen ligase